MRGDVTARDAWIAWGARVHDSGTNDIPPKMARPDELGTSRLLPLVSTSRTRTIVVTVQ